MVATRYIKIFFVLYLLYVSSILYLSPDTWHVIKNVNLIFHEAGHTIFILFGQFTHILGGTIFEIGVPLIITIHFLFTKQIFAAGFGAWWTSTALQSVSIYAADAQAQALPLLGGNSVMHDWAYLLSTTHLMQFTQSIGGLFTALSVIALSAGLYLFYKDLTSSLQTKGNTL